MEARPYTYTLPEERIAQRPVYPFDAARMLVVRRGEEGITSGTFSAFPELVRDGDLVIFNNSRVMPYRLFGTIEGPGTECEVLLLREDEVGGWRAIGRPLRRFREGAVLRFTPALSATVCERTGQMEVRIEFSLPRTALLEEIARVGIMPIPPYIRAGKGDEKDKEDYQSIFAAIDGSVAAPTASLHFTPEVKRGIEARGAEIETVTLHVGPPSFLPLWKDGEEELPITGPGVERFVHSPKVCQKISDTRRRGGRVFAVGTTVVRAVETMMREPEGREEGALLETSLFISPGFEFHGVNCVVTNFHQPRTSHLLLIESLLGRDLLHSVYEYALSHDCRFLSYGDGMVIL